MKKKILIIYSAILVLHIISSEVNADFGWADSSPFNLNLSLYSTGFQDSPPFFLNLLSYTTGFQNSQTFSLNLANVSRSWSDSDVFSYNGGLPGGGAGNGNYSGVLYDLITGLPIAGATVCIPGQPCVQTNEQGQFSFASVPSGPITITVTKTGYYSITQTVEVGGASIGFSPITMVREAGGNVPVVTQIQSKYTGPGKHSYYLNGISVLESFIATIDWKGKTPAQVKWILPNGTIYTDNISGNNAYHTFDMGGIGLGKLSVVAIAADSATSAPKQANCQVIPPPPGIPPLALRERGSGSDLCYSAEWILDAIDEGVDAGVIDEDIPGFGGRAFEFVIQPLLKAEITSDGTAKATILDGYELPSFETALVELEPTATVQLAWQYSSEQERWIPSGYIEVSVEGSYAAPPSYYVIMVGPVPIPVYWRCALETALAVKLALGGWAGNDAMWKGTIPFDIYAEIMLGVGIADVLAAEGYLGGGANMLLEFPNEKPLRELTIELNGGIRVVVFIFSYENNLLHYEWSLVDGKAAGMLSAPMTLGALDQVKAVDFRTMSRDYLGPDYALWSPGLVQERLGGMMPLEGGSGVPCEPDKEQLLQYKVFGQSQPTIAAEGGDLLLAWVYDDPNRDLGDMNSLNRTKVVFSKCSEGFWSEPVAIDDDGTADFSPQIAVLPDGNAICVWESAKQWLPSDANLTDMATAMEISAAHYDSASGTWTSQGLTDNGHLDRTPRIAVAEDGTAIAVWVENEKNDILGLDPNAANTIRYCLWDGTNWGEPNTATEGIGLMVKTSLAYNGSEAVYLYSLDTDYDWQTETDRELYAIIYDGNDWSDLYRLTDDSLLDANPQVVYDQNDLLLVWYRDANLVSLRNFDPNRFEEVLQTSGSSGSMDFRLAKGPAGQVSLIWTEASAAGVDIFTATYDAGLSVWSKAYQLTSDRGMERSVAATYAGVDEMALAYNKVEIIDINGIPDANRVDLYVLRHSIASDLAISAADISLSAANPTPGRTVDVNAAIHNLGDVAEVNVPVAFYDGEPNDGGTLIDDIQIIAGPIPAGDVGVATASWLVPVVNEPQRIFVVVDPNREREDRNWANNSAAISAMAPDLRVMSISSDRIGPKKRGITARIANIGTLPAENIDVVISRDSAGGPELTTFNIAKLDPNTFYDVWHVWDIAAEDFNDVEIPVYVNVDKPDDVLETNEENNIAFGLLQVGRAADVTDNGRIDFVDCAKLADVWLEECSEPEWCQGRDFDKNQKVDFADLEEMAESWLWQAGWYSH